MVPRSKYSVIISKAVKRTGLQVIGKSGQKIGSIVVPKLSKCRKRGESCLQDSMRRVQTTKLWRDIKGFEEARH